MDNQSQFKTLRRLAILSAAFLVASLAISAFNAYIALAAPPMYPDYSGPTTVTFEGYLTDSLGIPANGAYDLTFRLYSQATEGSELWAEQHSGVDVSDGLYSVQLGSANALSANLFSGERWLGIAVGTDGEMTPRISISAVPWALNATQAMGLQGRAVADTAPQVGEALVWDGSQWVPGSVDAGSKFATGSYVGNGQNGHQISLDFQPTAVLTIAHNKTFVIHNSSMGSLYCYHPGAAQVDCNDTDAIISLNASGFVVQNSGRVNASGVTYYYMAWGD